jgi:hypothetical protein
MASLKSYFILDFFLVVEFFFSLFLERDLIFFLFSAMKFLILLSPEAMGLSAS